MRGVKGATLFDLDRGRCAPGMWYVQFMPKPNQPPPSFADYLQKQLRAQARTKTHAQIAAATGLSLRDIKAAIRGKLIPDA